MQLHNPVAMLVLDEKDQQNIQMEVSSMLQSELSLGIIGNTVMQCSNQNESQPVQYIHTYTIYDQRFTVNQTLQWMLIKLPPLCWDAFPLDFVICLNELAPIQPHKEAWLAVSGFQFIPKSFDVVIVLPLCRPVRFFYTKLGKARLLMAIPGLRRRAFVETGNGLPLMGVICML